MSVDLIGARYNESHDYGGTSFNFRYRTGEQYSRAVREYTVAGVAGDMSTAKRSAASAASASSQAAEDAAASVARCVLQDWKDACSEDFKAWEGLNQHWSLIFLHWEQIGPHLAALPRGWTIKIDPESKNIYYVNEALRVSQWEKPPVEIEEKPALDGPEQQDEFEGADVEAAHAARTVYGRLAADGFVQPRGREGAESEAACESRRMRNPIIFVIGADYAGISDCSETVTCNKNFQSLEALPCNKNFENAIGAIQKLSWSTKSITISHNESRKDILRKVAFGCQTFEGETDGAITFLMGYEQSDAFLCNNGELLPFPVLESVLDTHDLLTDKPKLFFYDTCLVVQDLVPDRTPSALPVKSDVTRVFATSSEFGSYSINDGHTTAVDGRRSKKRFGKSF